MPTTQTGEIRQDLVTGRWVIYAPERADRPHELEQDTPSATALPEKDAECPFCIGNEHMLPNILLEHPGGQSGLWQTRVVPNKYPVLSADTETADANRGIYRVASNFGHHEVLIETPFHNRDIPIMRPDEVEAIIATYAQRSATLCGTDESVQAVVIFRNHGAAAGTSLLHPHSQIVATGLVPETIAQREHIAAQHFKQNHHCLLCRMIDCERTEGTRVIHENEAFLSFVPFAASVPCEIWIVPKRHCADFGLITEQEVEHLALCLQDGLQRLYDELNHPDYNYVIHNCSRQDFFVPHLHWYLQIQPRLTTPAGFEIGSGMQINHSLPERDAKRLRQFS